MYDNHGGNYRGVWFLTFASEKIVGTVVDFDAHVSMGKTVQAKRSEPKKALEARFRRNEQL